MQFPLEIRDRWNYYLEQNGLTPIGPLAHRLDLLARLDLRPQLASIPTEILLLQGNEDRIVAQSAFEELCAGLSNARGVVMPMVGHQPHFTHAEALAAAVIEWCLPWRRAAARTKPNRPPDRRFPREDAARFGGSTVENEGSCGLYSPARCATFAWW